MATTRDLLRSIPKRRKVQLRGKITKKKIERVISEINRLGRKSKNPIWLGIDCDGGNPFLALELYGAIKKCPVPVYAVVTKAKSAALIILQACPIRVGRPLSKYQVHFVGLKFPVRVHAFMDIPKALENLKDIFEKIEPGLRDHWRESVHAILLEKVLAAGKTEEEFFNLLHQDREMNAHEALLWGFITEIVKL